MAMSDLHRFPEKCELNTGYFNFVSSLQTEATCPFLLQENILELITFKPRKTKISSAIFVVNRSLPSLHGGSLEIMLAVP